MEQIGYSLIDASGSEVLAFGETKGHLNPLPNVFLLPNGDQVHCAKVGDQLGEWRFVERWLVDTPISQWYVSTGRTVAFDGTKIVVTVNYEATPSIVPPPPLTPAEKLAKAGLSVTELKTLLGLT